MSVYRLIDGHPVPYSLCVHREGKPIGADDPLPEDDLIRFALERLVIFERRDGAYLHYRPCQANEGVFRNVLHFLDEQV